MRKAAITRKTKETDITINLNIDGTGKAKIKTPIGLLNHMLELFAFHGCFDLTLDVKKADLEIDIHHTNEDIGIVLGKVFRKALGEMRGIKRFGVGFSPMNATSLNFYHDFFKKTSSVRPRRDPCLAVKSIGYIIEP